MFPPLPGQGRRSHTAIGVVVVARPCCGRGCSVGAGAMAAVLDTTGQDPEAMVTPPDIEAQILRYYHAEKWTAGTIARQLHVHHSVVRRVLAQAGLPRIGPAKRPSPIDAYLPLIHETLEISWRETSWRLDSACNL